MFNDSFYPTPRALAAKMTAGLDMRNKYVLEPSAGKGDLAKFCYGAKIHLIESEPELCDILQMLCESSRGAVRLVAKDFLSFEPSCDYDYIIMNPPFKNGAKHFLHAWAIADGCEIRCLLNAETLRNPHTQERENIAEIIKRYNGKVEFIADAFIGAERRTDVECALISIFKPAKNKLDLGLNSLFGGDRIQSENLGKEAQHTEIANPSFIKNSVASYNAAKDALKDVFRALAKFNYYADGCGIKRYSHHETPLYAYIRGGKQEDYNLAIDEITRDAWNDIFNKPSYQKLITSGVKDALKKEQTRLGVMVYNEANINTFLDTLLGTRSQVMNAAIIDSFDFLTTYDKNNIVHKEGWKTNSHYKVNKKIIVPALHHAGRCYGEISSWSLTNNGGKFGDLEQALCFILGLNFDTVKDKGICKVVDAAIKEEQKNYWSGKVAVDYKNIYKRTHDSYFFTIKLYKKGTMHLQFKSEEVWARFNQAAAEGKNWLG